MLAVGVLFWRPIVASLCIVKDLIMISGYALLSVFVFRLYEWPKAIVSCHRQMTLSLLQ